MIILTMPGKYPSAKLDYEVDFSGQMELGETVVGNPVVTVGASLVLETPAPSMTGSVAKFWLSGGKAPNPYAHAIVVITVNSGRKYAAKVIVPLLLE